MDIVNRLSRTSSSNEFPKVEFEDIIAGEGRLNKDIGEKLDNRKGILFKPENILYGKLRPYLKNWLFPEFHGIALGDFWVFEARNSIPVFVYYLIQSSNYQKVANDTAGTKMPRSDWKKVSTTLFAIPNMGEQKQLGTFFKQLDNTIALHQRKLDLLKLLKQTYLQRMFPQNEEKIPRIRFENFHNNWELHKLGDLVEFFSGLTYSPENIVELPGTFVLRSSNVKNAEIIDADNVYVRDEAVNSPNVKRGDIVVVVRNGSRDLIGKHAQIKKDMPKTVIGAFMTGVHSDMPNFTNSVLDTQQFRSEINKNLGATINQITIGSFKNMNFVVPINLDERKRIGNFFSGMDDYISLQNKKIDQLSVLKKQLLSKMFI